MLIFEGLVLAFARRWAAPDSVAFRVMIIFMAGRRRGPGHPRCFVGRVWRHMVMTVKRMSDENVQIRKFKNKTRKIILKNLNHICIRTFRESMSSKPSPHVDKITHGNFRATTLFGSVRFDGQWVTRPPVVPEAPVGAPPRHRRAPSPPAPRPSAGSAP